MIVLLFFIIIRFLRHPWNFEGVGGSPESVKEPKISISRKTNYKILIRKPDGYENLVIKLIKKLKVVLRGEKRVGGSIHLESRKEEPHL